MPEEGLKFRVELNVLKHLGIGLYSSTPSVMTEIISNSWDADSSKVEIVINPDDDVILVEDDGHGMTFSDVQDKFLKIGYSRRTREATKQLTRSGNRYVMGRKGIGKLAMFSLADRIQVVSRAEGQPVVAFEIDVKSLWQQAESEAEAIDYAVEPIPAPEDFRLEHGTRITLTQLKTKIHRTEDYLRPRLARRFGVFSASFQVRLNRRFLQRVDAGFYGDLQFLWHFDDGFESEIAKIAPNIAKYRDDNGDEVVCSDRLPDVVVPEPTRLAVKGFIGSVDVPAKLGRGEESVNKLAIFANGRLFQEDILASLGDARYFNSYLVGEIHADFLDRDDTDRATASREAIQNDDEVFQALRGFLKLKLAAIRDQWDMWRIAQGYENAPDKNQAIEDWIKGFKDKRDRQAANKIMTSISKLVFTNDEETNSAARKMLYKSAVVGFEKLKARDQLAALDNVTDVLSPEFQAIFSSLDDIEESYYLEIVRSRLEVIRKFEEEIVDQGKQEKVAQRYLFDHLWLLDPSWDRVSGSEVMEQTLTAELKRAHPDAETGARLDIAYRRTGGTHVIIELKRPGLTTKVSTLEEQGRKYVKAIEQWYRENPNAEGRLGRLPPVNVFFLVSEAPQLDQRDAETWKTWHLSALSYKGLIANARMAYQSYLGVQAAVGRVAMVLDSI